MIFWNYSFRVFQFNCSFTKPNKCTLVINNYTAFYYSYVFRHIILCKIPDHGKIICRNMLGYCKTVLLYMSEVYFIVFWTKSNVLHVLTPWHFLFWQKYSTSDSSLSGSLNSLKEKNQSSMTDINKWYWTIAFWIHAETWKIEKEWKYTSAPTHAFVMCTETILPLPCHSQRHCCCFMFIWRYVK
jgi:hypothetical protein